MSIPEIHKATGIAKTTIQRHVKNVVIPSKLLMRLKERQGGSKARAEGLRQNVAQEAQQRIGRMRNRDIFFLLVGLYWGEGTKRDFSVINSDPALIASVIYGVQSLGISRDRLEFSLRMHSDVHKKEAIAFWSKVTGLAEEKMTRIEVIEGKKHGKLKYGMCRIRVRSGIRERLLLQSAIGLIGKTSCERVVSA